MCKYVLIKVSGSAIPSPPWWDPSVETHYYQPMLDHRWRCNWGPSSGRARISLTRPCSTFVVNITIGEQGSWRVCLVLTSSPNWTVWVNSLVRGQGSSPWREPLTLTYPLWRTMCVINIPVGVAGPWRSCLTMIARPWRKALPICINRIFSRRTTPLIGLNCHLVTVIDSKRQVKSRRVGMASSSSTSMSPSRESTLDPAMPWRNTSYPSTESDSPPSLQSRSISASGKRS